MDISETIKRIEKAANAAEVSIDDLCARTGIHRATWQRWKAGTKLPTMRKWIAFEKKIPATIKNRMAA
jgi:hypothetical protein